MLVKWWTGWGQNPMGVGVTSVSIGTDVGRATEIATKKVGVAKEISFNTNTAILN